MIIEDMLDARILVEIGERGAFGAAAEAAGVPAATLSRRVRRMEQAAGARLFERTTRRVAPTEAGLAAIDTARRMTEASNELDALVEETSDAPRGTVRVSAMHDMGEILLASSMARFIRECPNCQLVISLVDAAVDLAVEHVDVAIRAGVPGPQHLVARRLGSVRLRMHAAPKVAAGIRSVDDLVTAPLGFFNVLAQTNGPTPSAQALVVRGPDVGGDVASTERTIEVVPRLKVNDFRVLRRMALEEGIVVDLPVALAAEDVAEGRLVTVLPNTCEHDVDLFAVMTSRRHVRPAVRRFVDIAAECIRAELSDE